MHRVIRPHGLRRWHNATRFTAFNASLSIAANPERIVLAIESSCDDSAVAVVKYQVESSERLTHQPRYRLQTLFNKRITANNDAYGGIHPLVALHSHQTNLALLVREALQTPVVQANLDAYRHGAPDFVAVTRGPGMRGNLSVGLDTAKGLAVAWNVPMIGVHHMQAHALTPRLISAEAHEITDLAGELAPKFPFLSVLASGGHTMLIHSTGLTDHQLIAQTQDIALGDCLDKAARAILPAGLIKTPYGRALEHFAFGNRRSDETNFYDYQPPARREDEVTRRPSTWGWSLGPPLAGTRQMMYSYAGLLTAVERLVKNELKPDDDLESSKCWDASDIHMQERQDVAREVQRVAFEHLASRILLYLGKLGPDWSGDTVIVSGGVAANQFLRHVLRSILDVRGYSHIKLSFPPIELCTDNALMIAWTGIEMYEAGFRSGLNITPVRKWSMDASSEDGGILGIGGWHQVTENTKLSPS